MKVPRLIPPPLLSGALATAARSSSGPPADTSGGTNAGSGQGDVSKPSRSGETWRSMRPGGKRGRMALIIGAALLGIAACSLREDRRESEPTTASLPARLATHADVSGLGPDMLFVRQILVDADNAALLVVGDGPSFRRCNHDGTACTAHALDAGRGASTSAVIDPFAKKLLVVTNDYAWTTGGPPDEADAKLSLHRCALDGSGCTWTDVSAGRAGLRTPPTALVDSANQKLVIGFCDGPAGGVERAPAIHRCDLDGGNCARVALTATSGSDACASSSMVIDDAASKLLFVAREGAHGRVMLHRCNVDGTGCTHTELAAAPSGDLLNAVIDSTNQKLLVTDDAPGSKPVALIRCNLDGTSCERRSLDGLSGHSRPMVVQDELVIGLGTPGGPYLVRCNLDGTSCTSKRLDLGLSPGGRSQLPAAIAFDAAHDMFLVGTRLMEDDGPGPYPIAPLLVRQPRDGSSHDVHDVTAGPGEMPYFGLRGAPSSLLDDVRGKVYVLSGNEHVVGLAEDRKTPRVLSRCNVDGTACTFSSALSAIGLVGVVDDSLIAVGVEGHKPNDEASGALELLRCNAEATSCTRRDLVRPFRPLSADRPARGVLDAQRRRALVVSEDGNTADARLFRCPAAAATCLPPVVLPFDNGSVRAIAFDAFRDRLLASIASFPSNRLALCDAQGASCTLRDVPTEIDGIQVQLLVRESAIDLLSLASPSYMGTYEKIVHVRCDTEGNACTRKDLPLGPGAHGLDAYGATIDTGTGELLVITDDELRSRRPTLLRCTPEGSSCVEIDMSAGQPAWSGAEPTALFDPHGRHVLAVTANRSTARASLFSLQLDGAAADGGAGTGGGGMPDGGVGSGTGDSGASNGGSSSGGSSSGGSSSGDTGSDAGKSGKTW